MDRIEKIRNGDVRTASRLIRDLEDEFPQAVSAIKELYPYTGQARVVGLTGAPGAGKSTLTDGILEALRKKGKSIGVLAVDPSSPYTGGAILGDRIRMQRHAEDPKVFIRSLATRGALGGISKAVGDSIHVLDSMGKDFVIIETVGIGQQEVEIMNYAHTVIVVLVPGMGDGVQTIKAGIMEIADVFVINKADRDGADTLAAEINLMLDMAASNQQIWRTPVVKIGNVINASEFKQGIDELLGHVDKHFQYLQNSGEIKQKMKNKALFEIKAALNNNINQVIYEQLLNDGSLETMINKMTERSSDAYTLSETVTAKYLKNI
ncbi:MAG: methylmalonyl Co-A mutase-associated GTPase MeaB [Syntrophomonadaceae bacterium]|jgi:LAO/AO transport system kinase|nr:methylmalonyl Co-A mutase-associated GTPase MeaB [Syntrophomonadaceae bacterium]